MTSGLRIIFPRLKQGVIVVHTSKIESEQLYGFLKSIPRNKDSTVFHLVRTSYTGYHVAKTLASLGIVLGGIPEYAWKYREMRLCNAIKAIRSGSNLSNDELIAIVEYYNLLSAGRH